MTKLFRLLLLAPALAWGITAGAQTLPAEIAAHPERSAGIYRSYEYLPGDSVPPPAGYTPFYISHYGRHGSRYHIARSLYDEPAALLREADKAGALTPLGREVAATVQRMAADAEERCGDLTQRGVREQRGIAERMFRSYPEVFSTDEGRACVVEARSTLVPRCILSMAAFEERLKELNPEIRATRDASRRYLHYLSNGEGRNAQFEAARAVADSMLRARLRPERLLASLFADPGYAARAVPDSVKFMERLFLLASILQDADYPAPSLYGIFTDEELYELWACENARRYLTMGPSQRFGDPIVADARPLLRNIVETAQEVIDGERQTAATLRFGHDVNIVPLLALLGIPEASRRVGPVDDIAGAWSVQNISPMAANLQLVFFRNAAGDVRVRVLLNERDVRLPFAEGPYYDWQALRAYARTLYGEEPEKSR